MTVTLGTACRREPQAVSPSGQETSTVTQSKSQPLPVNDSFLELRPLRPQNVDINDPIDVRNKRLVLKHTEYQEVAELEDLLSKTKIDVNFLNNQSSEETPLHLATISGNINLIKCLVNHGAKLEEIDARDFTPLFRAIDENKLDAAKTLLELGAKIDAPVDDGFDAIHMAAMAGSPEMIRLILDHGGKLDEKTKTGHLPKDLVKDGPNKEACLKLLSK
ncbi:MAG: ankyrin repeat domain-containing protein [Pirellulales bacterium]